MDYLGRRGRGKWDCDDLRRSREVSICLCVQFATLIIFHSHGDLCCIRIDAQVDEKIKHVVHETLHRHYELYGNARGAAIPRWHGNATSTSNSG